MKTQGTKEWATTNVNIQVGCENGCVYCYAWKISLRFNRLEGRQWTEPVKNEKAILKGFRKRKGRIMFPSSHDITPNNVEDCLFVLKKMLKAGNKVLIVTKPNYECIKKLCYGLNGYQDQILFRFTINTFNEHLANLYEPNAPNPQERFQSLKFAFSKGYMTSISAEPYLFSIDSFSNNPLDFLMHIHPYITNTIWIGPMNKRYCPKELWLNGLWSDEQQIKTYNNLKHYLLPIIFDKIRFKDSFVKE